MSYKWNHTVCGLLCLASFTSYNYFEIHSCYWMYQWLPLPSGRISESRKRIQPGYVFSFPLEPYCYWSTLVCCIQCLKCTALGPSISYPFHTVTFPYFQKLLFPWLLWPRAANILPLFLVLGIAASCIGQTSRRLKMSLYWRLLNCCIWMCLVFLLEHWCSSKWFKYL